MSGGERRRDEEGQYLVCALCGFEFQAQDTLCLHGCPLHSHCGLRRCPSCGYEFATRQPSLLSWLRRRLRPSAAARSESGESCEVLPLSRLEAGRRAEIVAVGEEGGSRRRTLAVFGLVPGSEIELLQKSPAFVVRVGETELALEGTIAAAILVRGSTPEGEPA